MRCDSVVIEELLLRLPGVHPGDARELVEEVLRRVQENLRGSGRIGRHRVVELKVRVPSGARRAEWVDAIAKELTEALR